MKLISEKDAREIAALEKRLIEFYNTSHAYAAFAQPSDYPVLWGEVLKLARPIRDRRGTCRILEIGAGRSGFGSFRRGKEDSEGIHLTSQDITATNLEHLRATSDVVVTENIDRLEGAWDIIFHTYVYEHLCRPREFNERLWGHLTAGGYLLIQSPRYDLPWYFPPCFDHLPLAAKVWHAMRLTGSDLVSRLSARPRFTIFSDPAILHLPFRRDRDAVHRVRQSDVRQLFAGRAHFSEFSLPAGNWKDWIVKRLLTLRIILRKTA